MFIWKWELIGHHPNRKNTITYVIHATVRLKPLYQNHSQKNYCVQNVAQKWFLDPLTEGNFTAVLAMRKQDVEGLEILDGKIIWSII